MKPDNKSLNMPPYLSLSLSHSLVTAPWSPLAPPPPTASSPPNFHVSPLIFLFRLSSLGSVIAVVAIIVIPVIAFLLE